MDSTTSPQPIVTRRSTWARVLVALATVFLSAQAAPAAVNIDNFDLTVQFSSIFGNPPGFASTTNVSPAPEAIGAERDIYLTRTSNDGGFTSADVGVSKAKFFAYSSGPSTTGNALIEWDGSDGLANNLNPTGLGGIDLTQGGSNSGILIKASSDLGTALVVKVYSNAANFSTASVAVPADPTFTTVSLFIPFTTFTTAGGSGANFANVGAVTLFVANGTPALDVFIGLIAATNPPQPPPPGSGSLGNFIWHDQDRDGIQDAGEPGIGGVVVNLINPATNGLIDSTVTDGSGFYQFTGLGAGTYRVEVDATTLPPGFVPTTSNVGSNDAIDSDGSPVVVTLPTNTSSDQTIDFGYKTPCTGTIGDFIWHDQDRDGLQDAGEPGIAGVTVNLLNAADNSLLAMTVTNGSGAYQFTGLCAGSYIVKVDATTVPPNFTPTLSNVGADDGADSDGSPVTVTLPTDNTNNPTIDFGFQSSCTGKIGDFVWHDQDRDGLQDAGEPGLDGVTVNLRNLSNNLLLATTITGPNGFYQFTGLCAGNYKIEIDATTLPAGFTPTPSMVGGNSAIDSNGSPATVTLPTDSSSNQTIDFGFQSPCTGMMGNFVWHDLNQNGIQEPGEPGIGGVTVNLRDPATNTLLATTMTDANGFYQFGGLCAGSYTVEVVPPQGFLSTTSNAPGSNTTNDSNVSPALVVLATDNSSDQTIDFGFFRGQLMCLSTDTSGSNPIGVLSFFVDVNGDVTVRYDQSLTINDNSYGVNIVNWPRSHSFNDLVGSDKAQFQFRDANRNLVLDFFLDYITAKSGTPSGYASLGVSGGDGGLTTGNAAHILAFDTSLARNLNATGLCTAGNCTVSGVNLLVNSPPANTNYQVLNPVFSQWNFTDSYSMKISHLAFGAAGFGSVSVGLVHDSPPKFGSNAVTPVPCGPPGPPQPPPVGTPFCKKDVKPQVLTMQYTGEACSATHHSQDPSKVTCSGTPALASPVRIVASDKANPSDPKAKLWFDGTVLLNGTFNIAAGTAGATKLGSDTYVRISSSTGTLLQSIKFHTSCSQPLNAGDQFGSLILVNFVPE